MAISKNNDRLTIIIDKKLKEDLSKIAERDGRSTSNYVARLIEKHITEHPIHKVRQLNGNDEKIISKLESEGKEIT